MNCPTCGQAAKGGERFCSNCGTDLTQHQLGVVPSPITGEPMPMPVPNTAPVAQVQPVAQPAPAPVPAPPVPVGELRGVGGWLLIFCLWITVVDPLLWLRVLPYLRYMTANPMLLFSLGVTIFGVVLGIMLWQQNPSAIPLARVFFVVVALEWVMSIAMYFFRYSRMPGVYIWSFLWTWLRVAGFLAGWVSYFRVSVRVRNTYGANL